MVQTSIINRPLAYLTAVLVVLVGCSSDRTNSVGVATSAPVAAPTDTTDSTNEVATTAVAATTTLPPTTLPPTTLPPTPTTIPVGPSEPAADSPTAWEDGAEDGDPEVSAAPGVCEPFYAAIAGGPYTEQRCGLWNAIGGQRMWTVTKGATNRFFAIIWQQTAPNQWIPVLRALEESPGLWSDFVVRTSNIDAGSNDELVSGARLAGTGGYLDISVVDIRSGAPRVMAVFNGLAKGVAVLRAGNGVETWSGVFADADPGCCPSSFVQNGLVADGGDWLLTSGATVTAGDPTIPVTAF